MRRAALILVLLAATTAAAPARAEQAIDVGAIDFAALGLYTAGALAVYYGTTPPSTARWTGGFLIDDPIQDALYLTDETGRSTARLSSDILQSTMIFIPVFVDALLVKGAIDGEFGNALRLVLIDAESFALTAFVVTALKNASGRRRSDDRGNHAFPSGHTATAFTGAGLMCAQHGALRLYGNDTVDDAMCAVGLAAATATAVLRISSGRHWASDTIASAIIGLLSGYLMPALMHDALDPALPRIAIAPDQNGATLNFVGSF